MGGNESKQPILPFVDLVPNSPPLTMKFAVDL